MIHLLLNGLAASAGGGLTYLRNVVPQLAAREDVSATIIVRQPMHGQFAAFSNIHLLEVDQPHSAFQRFWWEQSKLAGIIKRAGADVLISTGNFALRKSPVPQILLSRNSLYTSAQFLRDVRGRHDYGLWLDTKIKSVLAKKSIQWADRTVAPSQAFASDLEKWSGQRVLAIQHGFDRELFFHATAPLAPQVQGKLEQAEGALKLLFVSHYNYYRNFETLLRALPLLNKRLPRPVKLLLTCHLQSELNPGSYRAGRAAELVRELDIREQVIELGPTPYESLHHLYKICDIYVSPAYTESFAHPLVEAMASGLPIAASDLVVHREICQDAALYFPAFSPPGLADRIAQIADNPEPGARLSDAGKRRSNDFSWKNHTDRLITLAGDLRSDRQVRMRAA